MNITEVRIKLMESSEDRLRAFCSITIDDCFVIRDLKIIDGSSGPFVAMPSRKLAGHCPRCRYKNHLRAKFCNQCGTGVSLDAEFADSPQKLYADVAHPINSDCREVIQDAVIEEFEAELARASEPGYRSRYDDDFGEDAGPDTNVDAPEVILDPAERSGPSRPRMVDNDRRSRSDRSTANVTGSGSPKRSDDATSDQDQGDQQSGGFGSGIFE